MAMNEEPEEGRLSSRDRWLAVALGLCAAIPVMVSTALALKWGWLPAGDQANIATRAYDVFTSRTPLLGLHSDVSYVTHHDVYSLGPMLFWLLALPARFASPWTMVLVMGLVNAASVVGVVVLAARLGGRLLMFITAIALIIMTRSLTPELLHDVWNPAAGLFPFTLLMFVCWSLGCGEYRLLPLAVLVASFVVQCQLAFVPPCLALLVIGFSALGVSLRHNGARVGGRSRDAQRSVWPWALAALLVAVACWTTPAIDEIEAKPGNIGEIITTVEANRSTLGPTAGWNAVVRAVGIPPWWLTDPSSPWARKYEVRTGQSQLAVDSCVLVLFALLALAAAGLRLRRNDLLLGALIALALCGVLAASAASTPTTRVLAETLGYTMWWGSPAGMFAWLMVGWPAAALLSRRFPWRGRLRAVPVVASIGIAATTGSAVAATARPDYHRSEYGPLAVIYSSLDASIPAGRTVRLIGSLGNATFRFKMAARFALVRRGIRPLSPGIDVRLGSWYELDHHAYDCTVYVNDGDRSPASSGGRAAVIARVTYHAGTVSYPLSVWVSPAGCPKATPRS